MLFQEMLSRSSLETQKLELMSAMSELKLQQAALERENLELRTNFVTSTVGSAALINGGLTNGSGGGAAITNVLNNNSITSSLLRRPQIITNTRMVGMSPSTPGGASLISSPIHHGSHGSLPQTAISPITPKSSTASFCYHLIDSEHIQRFIDDHRQQRQP
uniref:Liprin-beta-1/2 coiled-coil domain-containing protein n=1 Tax=Anopheles maculatus TaxID=74869 RepID=A0A182SHS1_9DIPT